MHRAKVHVVGSFTVSCGAAETFQKEALEQNYRGTQPIYALASEYVQFY
jgi:hypothetical protein